MTDLYIPQPAAPDYGLATLMGTSAPKIDPSAYMPAPTIDAAFPQPSDASGTPGFAPTIDPNYPQATSSPPALPSSWHVLSHMAEGKPLTDAYAAAQADLATPPAQSPPSIAPPPLDPDANTSRFGDALDNFLTGGVFRKGREARFQAQTSNYVAQRNYQIGSQIADPQARALFFSNPQAFADAEKSSLEDMALKQGETRSSPLRGNSYAPSFGLSPAGVGYSVTPAGMTASTPQGMSPTGQLPGTVAADTSGNLVDANRGYVGSVPVLQKKSNGESVDYYGGLSGPTGGPPAGTPMLGANGAVAPAGFAPTSAPLGVKNNNLANVKALPNGQSWRGQTGTDANGYAIFDTPANGQRAAMRNMASYGKYDGISNVGDLVDRWASSSPAATRATYKTAVAKALGVGVGDKIDLTSPQTQSALYSAMVPQETGSQGVSAMASRSAPAPAQGAPQGAPGSRGNPMSSSVGRGVSTPAYNPATETWQQTDPEGHVTDVAKNPFGTQQQLEYAKSFMASPQYQDYDQLNRFHDTAVAALKRGGGPADLQLIDMAIKANNPTLGARPNQVDQAVNEIGPLNQWAGEIKAVVDNGQRLSPAARQAMVNVVDDARQASWKSMQPLLGKAQRDAAKHGLDVADLIPGVAPPTGNAPPGSGFGSDIPQVSSGMVSVQDAARLPSGTRFQGADGKWRVKR